MEEEEDSAEEGAGTMAIGVVAGAMASDAPGKPMTMGTQATAATLIEEALGLGTTTGRIIMAVEGRLINTINTSRNGLIIPEVAVVEGGTLAERGQQIGEVSVKRLSVACKADFGCHVPLEPPAVAAEASRTANSPFQNNATLLVSPLLVAVFGAPRCSCGHA